MHSPTKRRGPYAKTREQREKILRTALEYFGQNGYHGASMRQIARLVGLSQAGLLHHFPTKEGLLTAVLQERDTLSAEALAPEGEDQPTIDTILALVEHNTTQPHLVQMFTTVSAEAADPSHPAHEHFQNRLTSTLDGLSTIIRNTIEAGQAPADLDVETAARLCQATMYGLQVQWLLDPSIDVVALYRSFLESAILAAASPQLAVPTD